MKKGIRHGELILIPVKATLKKTKNIKDYIVAHSETGHHHVIESDVAVDEDKWLIELFEDSAIVHQKTFDQHKTLPLEKAVIAGKIEELKRFQAIDAFNEHYTTDPRPAKLVKARLVQLNIDGEEK